MLAPNLPFLVPLRRHLQFLARCHLQPVDARTGTGIDTRQGAFGHAFSVSEVFSRPSPTISMVLPRSPSTFYGPIIPLPAS